MYRDKNTNWTALHFKYITYIHKKMSRKKQKLCCMKFKEKETQKKETREGEDKEEGVEEK